RWWIARDAYQSLNHKWVEQIYAIADRADKRENRAGLSRQNERALVKTKDQNDRGERQHDARKTGDDGYLIAAGRVKDEDGQGRNKQRPASCVAHIQVRTVVENRDPSGEQEQIVEGVDV